MDIHDLKLVGQMVGYCCESVELKYAGLRNAMTCACNALADSTDANTLLWVAKMRKFLRDGE